MKRSRVYALTTAVDLLGWARAHVSRDQEEDLEPNGSDTTDEPPGEPLGNGEDVASDPPGTEAGQRP